MNGRGIFPFLLDQTQNEDRREGAWGEPQVDTSGRGYQIPLRGNRFGRFAEFQYFAAQFWGIEAEPVAIIHSFLSSFALGTSVKLWVGWSALVVSAPEYFLIVAFLTYPLLLGLVLLFSLVLASRVDGSVYLAAFLRGIPMLLGLLLV